MEDPINNNTDNVNVSAEHQQDAVTPKRDKFGVRGVLGLIGVLCAIGAWGVFFFDSIWAAWLALLSALLAIVGITVGKGCLRDVCITALIAVVVLLVVFGLFYWGLPYILNTI